MQLRQGTPLQGGKYRIEKVLGQGGFGITYLAMQTPFDRRVCIKEFFMKDYCQRNSTMLVAPSTVNGRNTVENFRRKFLREARIIFDFNHPAIARCFDFFEENNTAYYVMDYIDGHTLRDIVKARGPLPEAEAVAYIRQVAEALTYIHSHHINHLDIKPSNIMVRSSDNGVIVIDFGLAKHYDEGSNEQTTSTPPGISHGYAPLEQYRQGGVATFSPPTDIYALGATLYYLLTGITPPQATDLVDASLAFPAHINARMQSIINKAITPRRTDRPATIARFLDLFNKEKSSSDLAAPTHSRTPTKSSKAPRTIAPAAPSALHTSPKSSLVSRPVPTTAPEGPYWPKEQYQLGARYYHSHLYDEAVKWFLKAAEKGHDEAEFYLGECYYFGYGVEKDYTEAVKWFLKSAEKAHNGAEYYLGECFYFGHGVEKDYNEAIRWFRKAVDCNKAIISFRGKSEFYLGECYSCGHGVVINRAKAFKWFGKAAANGNKEAQFKLYEAVEKGNKDAQRELCNAAKLGKSYALSWIHEAVNQGNADAQYSLGFCYYNGRGVSKDYDKAVTWFRMAADQGHANAQYMLGLCYDCGEGVEISRKKAKEYWKRAEENGHPKAKNKLKDVNKPVYALLFCAIVLIGVGIFAFFRGGWLMRFAGCFCASLSSFLLCFSYHFATHKDPSQIVVVLCLFSLITSCIGLGIFALIGGNLWLLGIAMCGLIVFYYIS